MAGPRLLIVDDDRGNCAVITRILAGLGYETDQAFDGPSALALSENKSYELAVLDFQMPGMNGVELYEQLSARQPSIIGVFLTAYPRINTVYPAIGAGAERVLAKPVNFSELLPLIESLVGPPTSNAGSTHAQADSA
jgi:CheY-like chemotaxis protein